MSVVNADVGPDVRLFVAVDKVERRVLQHSVDYLYEQCQEIPMMPRGTVADNVSGVATSPDFRDFYERALPVVYGYFLRRCGGRVDVAEELTQETFLSAVKTLRKGVEIEAPLPWVVTIARRRLVDHYRLERRHRDRVWAFAAEEAGRAVLAVPPATSSAEAKLVTALERVPTMQRLALVLRYVDDLPVQEVANLINRSEQATESLLGRGRRSLQRTYQELDD